MLIQFFCIPPRLPVLIFIFCRFSFCVWACPGSCSLFTLADLLKFLTDFLVVGMYHFQTRTMQVRVSGVLWEDMTRWGLSEEGCEEKEECLGRSCIHLIYSWGVTPMCIHYQWCCLPNYTDFLFEDRKNTRKRDQLRVSKALERLGTVQISKRCLTAFFKYLCETQLHMTEKWYTHCAGIISNWNSARPF